MNSIRVSTWLAAAGAVLGVAVSPASAAEFATVVSSTPVTASVPVTRPVCSDGEQLVQRPQTGAGAVIGAIAGGLIGHGIGGGFGRAAATGVGVVAGSVIGDQIEANGNAATAVPVRRCQNVSSYERRTVGYDVMYEYAGQRYSTRMARDPGARFAVSVQPAEGALPTPLMGQPVPPAAPAAQPVYAEPAPQVVYDDAPRPLYYAPAPAVYIAPIIGFGLGYYGGYYRGGFRGHWR